LDEQQGAQLQHRVRAVLPRDRGQAEKGAVPQSQRWVIAIKKTNQLPTTLPIILYLVIGITN